MENMFKGKKILVTGGTGSIGSVIVEQLLRYDPEVVRILSRDESKQFFLQQKLLEYENVRFLIGEIRDKDRINTAMNDIDIVFHAAALKHVPSCEYNPFEAVETNVRGTQNIIQAAIGNNVERVISISTDKAVNPVNVMGATKLLMERILIAAQFSTGKHNTRFSCVRFGNVLGSRGSLLDLFRSQIQVGGPVTVTNPEMTRFFMKIEDAVDLVFQASKSMKGGELFILKMPSARLGDIVDVAIEEMAPHFGFAPDDIRIKNIGIRPGEKMHEELMTGEEAARAIDNEKMFMIVPELAYHYGKSPNEALTGKGSKKSPEAFSSLNGNLLNKDRIRAIMREANLLNY
jgi:UDP-N-acetylglucosamine 4,6-dehydratase